MSEDRAFYDNLDVRANYLAHRDRTDNPNDTLERPIFLELAGNLDIFDLFTDTGFEMERVREARPQKDNFLSAEEYTRRLLIPLFLFIAARKPK